MAFPAGMFAHLTADEQQYLNQQRLSMEAMQQTIAGLTTAGATRSGTGGRGSGSGRDGDERGNGLLIERILLWWISLKEIQPSIKVGCSILQRPWVL